MKVVNLKLEADTNSGPPGVVVEFDDGSRVDFGLSGYAGDWYIVPENRTIKDYLPKAEEAMKAACKRYRNSLSHPNLEALASFCNRAQQAPKAGLHGLGSVTAGHGRITGYIGDARDILRLEDGWLDVTRFIGTTLGAEVVEEYRRLAANGDRDKLARMLATDLVEQGDYYEGKLGRQIEERGLADSAGVLTWLDMTGDQPSVLIKLNPRRRK